MGSLGSSVISGIHVVRDTIAVMSRTVRYMIGLEKWSVSALFVIHAAEAAFPIASLWFAKSAIDLVTTGEDSADMLYVLLGGFLFLGIAAQVLIPLSQNLRERVGQKIEAHSETTLLRKVNSIHEIAIFEISAFYDKLRNATEASGRRFAGVIDIMMSTMRSLLLLVGSVAILSSLHWALGLLLLLGMLPHYLVTFWVNKNKFDVFRAQAHDTREQRYYASVLTSAETAKEVRTFGLGGFFLEKFREAFTRVFERSQRFRKRAWKVGALSGALSGTVSAGAFAWVVLQAYRGTLTIGDAVLYIGLLPQAARAMSNVLGQLASVHFASLHAKHFFDFLEFKLPAQKVVGTHSRRSSVEYGYEIRDVSFTYPGSHIPALESVSFSINPGEKVALVGRNGAGKSTLVKLLLRLYNPDAGEILLNGVPLSALDVKDLRKRVAVVFQDYARFFLTVRQNISLGDLSRDPTDEWIRAVSEKSGVGDFTGQLPAGYDTLLGKQFDGGFDLSGGQWQRIAIARALAREASLIVLDEPSSALDAMAESELFRNFSELTRDKSALFITHRLGSVRMADKIVTLKGGTVVEVGSHDQLVNGNGEYATLFNAQAENYTLP